MLSITAVLIFFFFKQKTAYEMRISDWSSDVCSSDLQIASENHSRPVARHSPRSPAPVAIQCAAREGRRIDRYVGGGHRPPRIAPEPQRAAAARWRRAGNGAVRNSGRRPALSRARTAGEAEKARRSEEHTSELQSLMRISYAVF